jgi:hypothetical protein
MVVIHTAHGVLSMSDIFVGGGLESVSNDLELRQHGEKRHFT